MPNGTYGGVRGRKTKVGRKLLRFPPTRLLTTFFYRTAIIGNILCLCIKITTYKYEANNEKTVCGQIGRMDWERTDNCTYRSKKSR